MPAPLQLPIRVRSRSPERAGAVIARLAYSLEFAGRTGRFYRDGKEIRASPYARDPAIQRRLWEVSEQLTRARST